MAGRSTWANGSTLETIKLTTSVICQRFGLSGNGRRGGPQYLAILKRWCVFSGPIKMCQNLAQFKHTKHPVLDMLKLLLRNLAFSIFHLHCTAPPPLMLTWQVQIWVDLFSGSQIQMLLYTTCRIGVPAAVLYGSPLWISTQNNGLLLLLSGKAY